MESCILDIILLQEQTTLAENLLWFLTSTVNLLLFLRIPFCLRFDTNKWLWDLEGLIWNSTCLAVKTAEWNNCFSAGNQTWQRRSQAEYLSPCPWRCGTLIQFIHVSIREEWKRSCQKNPFHYCNIVHLSCRVCSHVIDYKSFLKQRKSRVQLCRRKVLHNNSSSPTGFYVSAAPTDSHSRLGRSIRSCTASSQWDSKLIIFRSRLSPGHPHQRFL